MFENKVCPNCGERIKKGWVFCPHCGGEIEIKTLEGTNLMLQIPEGTESGKVLRISGKGIPHFGGYGRGNLYIELRIKTPKRLTREQKKLLEELKNTGI